MLESLASGHWLQGPYFLLRKLFLSLHLFCEEVLMVSWSHFTGFLVLFPWARWTKPTFLSKASHPCLGHNISRYYSPGISPLTLIQTTFFIKHILSLLPFQFLSQTLFSACLSDLGILQGSYLEPLLSWLWHSGYMTWPYLSRLQQLPTCWWHPYVDLQLRLSPALQTHWSNYLHDISAFAKPVPPWVSPVLIPGIVHSNNQGAWLLSRFLFFLSTPPSSQLPIPKHLSFFPCPPLS